MPLDAALVASLAASCAPGVAPETLLAIVRVESGLDPWAIGVNGPAGAERPASAEAAIRRAQALIGAGHDLDLGLAQINVRNLARLNLSVREAFDPCRNLAAAGAVLTHGYARAPSGSHQARLRVALSYYNTGHPYRGFSNGYVARVERAAGLRANTPASAAAAADRPSPTTSAPAWDVFARARARRAGFVLTSTPGEMP